MNPKSGWISGGLSRPGKDFGAFLWKFWPVDECLDFRRDFFRTLLGDLEFSPYGFDIDLGEALLEGCLPVKEDVDVLWVVEVFDQGSVGNHGFDCFAHRMVSRSASIASFEFSEESLHDVVGALWLDGDFSGWRVNDDGIGEEFVAIFVNLFDDIVVGFAFEESGACAEFSAEYVDGFLDGLDVGVPAVAIEAVAARVGSHSHRIAQLVKHRRLLFHRLDGLIQSRV